MRGQTLSLTKMRGQTLSKSSTKMRGCLGRFGDAVSKWVWHSVFFNFRLVYWTAAKLASASLLQRLADALAADVTPRGRVSPSNLSDVLNLYLLLVAARPGVRLDRTSYARHRGVLEPWETSNLLRVFREEARASGLRVAVVLAYEPIVVDLQHVKRTDVDTIRKLYTPELLARDGDMNEPLVGAIGRALGYGCGPSGLRDEARDFVSIEVFLHSSGARRSHSLWLAAFGCAKNDVRKVGMDHWAKARSALEGQVVRFRGRKYTIESQVKVRTAVPRHAQAR